jgi:nucleoside-diphosphate-sugar epimerase
MTLTDAKILVTGLTGQIAWPMAVELAADNEVWGAARFSAEGSRERVEAAGIVPVTVDLAAGDFSGLPDDFTHLLHFAAYQGADPDWDHAPTRAPTPTGTTPWP